MSILETVLKKWLAEIEWFSRLVVRRPLYAYQLAPARAIIDSVLRRRGLEFAVMFPRQSGKNETQAQVEAYLLNLFQRVPGMTIVKAQPTFSRQGRNAMDRLASALSNDWNKGQWKQKHGFTISIGQAQVVFFSAEPQASAVGATANLLLECDEAQDVLEAEWEKKFVPMAASTNATTVLWGTAWTSRTLLAKTIRHLRELEARDGIRRVFVVTPDQVAEENPAFGAYLERQVAKKGRQHPLIKTQFFNEELDAEGGMFPLARRLLMQGTHARQSSPTLPDPAYAGSPHTPTPIYCLLLDVAGEDEGATGERTDVAALENPRRDATVLTIVEVDLSTVADPVLAAPTYRCVDRRIWVGVKHSTLYGILRAIARAWRARYVVADATGVGAGLVSFLTSALGAADPALGAGGVIPFIFSAASKSKLGWDFIGICEAGRFQSFSPRPAGEGPGVRESGQDPEHTTWQTELEFCQYEVMPGPAHLLRWGVPDGTRDPATAEMVHDDTVLSAALVAVLDELPWSADTGPGLVLHQADPLDAMSEGF